MEEKELAKEIVEHCKKEKIKASFNIPYKGKLVNFEVKHREERCSECGKLK